MYSFHLKVLMFYYSIVDDSEVVYVTVDVAIAVAVTSCKVKGLYSLRSRIGSLYCS